MEPDWRSDVQRLFGKGGWLTCESCPNLSALVEQWMLPEFSLQSRRLAEFIRSVIWNADRREFRAQTALDWTDLVDRRKAREGVLGFLFLPRMDESVGTPRSAGLEALVKAGDPVVRPDLQSHRQRWAALRETVFERGEDEAKSYKPSTLFQNGRVANAQGRYAHRLIADIEEMLNDRDELAVTLNDCIPMNQQRPEWPAAYQDLVNRVPTEWLEPERIFRGAATSELDESVETHHDASVFVCDVTLPDGTLVPRGTTVTKTWRLRNAGSVPWVGRRLKRLTPHTNIFPATMDTVPIPDTLPGEEVDISVDLTTSHIEGTSELRFKMIDANGELCFPERYSYGLIVSIVTSGSRADGFDGSS